MPFKDETAFKNWSQNQQYSSKAIALIQRIRSSPPARNVRGGRGNVRARVPSYKMGVTIQSESRTVEKPGMRVFYEYDDIVNTQDESPVIEYYDQPEKIALKYRSKTGRQVTAWHTPDFFVIREDGVSWEEWKTEAELEQLGEKHPHRYCRDEQGRWHCPPGKAYANQFGLNYRLRSNAEINWVLYSNLEFLHEYLTSPSNEVTKANQDWVVQTIQMKEGILLINLLQTDGINSDDIYTLIAQRHIYVDLCGSRLVEPENVQVFTSQSIGAAQQHLEEYEQEANKWHVLSLEPGSQLVWDGEIWELVNPGVVSVRVRHIQSKQIQDIPRAEFERDLARGRIETSVATNSKVTAAPQVKELLAGASEADFAVANARLQVLKELDGGRVLAEIWSDEDILVVLGSQKATRTIRQWRQQFSEAETRFGNGYIGLIPRSIQRGNYQRKIAEATLEKMDFFIETRYEDLRQSSVISVWAEYCKDCEAEGLSPVSLMTFNAAVKKRPQEIQVKKRQGKRAAHQVKKHYWYLKATTPKHGERAWQIVHIDHTQLDVQLVHSRTGKVLGRPWATFAVDAYSRRLLAVVLTLDEQPSYRNCMLVLRELVRRLRRLPQSIYVDNGLEFHSTYFQALLAQYGVEVAYRPPAQPRFGDVVERLFGTANTQFVHTLTGNTQIAKEVRLMTKSNDPEHLAIWNLEWLSLALREWAYEVYDQAEHVSLGQSPREAFAESLQWHGERRFKWIDYDMFVFNALPTPKQGKSRKVHPSGVKINHIYYWHDWMYRPDIASSKVAVRYDPFNVGIAYAYLDKEWVRCTSEYFPSLSNRSEQEIQIAREEIVARYRRHGQVVRTVNARLLADFLERTTMSERLLKQQQRDNALRHSAASISRTEFALEAQDQQLVKAEIAEEQERQQQVQQVCFEHLTLPDDF
jgi:putative transposase